MSQKYQKDNFLNLLDELNDTISVPEVDFDSAFVNVPLSGGGFHPFEQNHSGSAAQQQPLKRKAVSSAAQSVAELERKNLLLQNKNEKLLQEYARLFKSHRKQEEQIQEKLRHIQQLTANLSAKGSEDVKKTKAINEIIQKLKNINEQHKVENANLKMQMAQTQSAMEKIRQQSESLRAQSQKLKSDNDRLIVLSKNLTEEVKEIGAHKQAFVDEVKQLQAKHLEQSKVIDEQKQSLVKLTQEIKNKSSESSEVHQRFLEMKDSNNKLRATLEEQAQELSTFKTQNNELQRVLKECKVVIEKQKTRIAGEVKFIEKIDSLNLIVNRHQQTIDQYARKTLELEKQVQTLADVKEKLEHQLKEMSFLKNVETQEKAQLKAQKEQEVQSLQAQLVTTTQKLERLLSETTKNYDEILEQSQKNYEQKLAENAKQIEFLTQANETLTETIYSHKTELDNAKLAIQKESDEKNQAIVLIDRLKAHAEKLNASRKKTLLKVSRLDERLKSEQETNRNYIATMSEMEQKQTLNHRQVEEQKATVERLTITVKEKAAQNKDLQTQFESVQKTVQELEFKLQDSELAYQNSVSEVKELEKRNDTLETKMSQIKEVVQRTNQSLVQMQKDLASEQTKNQGLQSEIADLKKQIAVLNTDKKSVLAENHILKTDIKTAHHAASTAQAMFKELAAKMKQQMEKEKLFIEREVQVQDYKNWLDANKAFIAEHVDECIGVIKQTLNLNPITEYLKGLNSEITKLDALLASQNVFGSIRAHYEELKAKLDEQRQASEKLLQAYNYEVEQKTLKLEMALQHQDFWEAPPLPPKPNTTADDVGSVEV